MLDLLYLTSLRSKSLGFYCYHFLMNNSHLAGENRQNRHQGHCRSIESHLGRGVATIVVTMTPARVVQLGSIIEQHFPVGHIWAQFNY